MRAISPNRQTGVATHVLSRSEWLGQARSPPQSTQGSPSPHLFGQDLVKLPERQFEQTTFALTTSPGGVHEPSQPITKRHDPLFSLRSPSSTTLHRSTDLHADSRRS